ncbi:MAG TPA: lectin-like protein [bacterium]|nr:lectin-like protein [bacterium]HRQ68926.1 lectin-like protein [bacterium]
MFNLLKKLGSFVVLAIVLLSGCDNLSKESGTFSVKFTWPENNKPDFSGDSYYAWIDIREWIDGDAENMKIHLKEGPVAFDNEGKLTLKLENLSYGKNRVIVVEVRKSNSDQDRTLYYGISDMFDLDPGKHTDVTVDMNFTPGTVEGNNSFAIDIFQNDVKITSTANEKVSIRVFKATGSKVVFSNRLDLLDIQINNETRDYTGSEVIDFSTLTKIDDITFEYPEWDLTAGREDAENGDGNKTVYAKVIDSNGYRSEMAYASVNLDTTDPSVSNITISPAGDPGLANIGTQIVVKFIMSEPVTDLMLFSDGIEMIDKSSGSDMYFVYTVTDADVDGSVYNFKVSAKDNAGNQLNDFPLGSVQIDSTLPELLNFSVSKNKVRTGEEFSVSLEVSEALKNINVLVGAKSISDKCNLEDGSETKYICKHFADIDGDEGDGVKQIAVELTDLAGNKMSQTLKKDAEPVTIEYDITAPILASAVILPETVNRSSDKINLKFSFAEKVNFDLSDLVLDPDTDLVFDCGDISTASKSFECSAPFAKEDQRVADYNVSVSVSDEVGNESKDIELGTISVDRISPFLSNQNVTPEAVKLNEEFVITFSVSEELLADPLVRVGDKTLPGSECGYSSTTSLWTCTHQANKDGDEPDGQKMVSVYIVDKAGNAATEILTKSINYDATPPVMINPVFIPGAKLNSYDGLFWVRFSFSERVLNDDSFVFSYVTDEGDIFNKPVSCSSTDGMNQSFSCAFNLLPEDNIQGKYTFFIDATDLSGNRLAQDGTSNKIGTIEVDRKLPEINIVSVDPENVNYETDHIEVVFTTNEPVQTLVNPEVKFGTNIQTSSPFSVNAERTEFIYHITNLQMAYDGTNVINIKAGDLSGNTGDASRGGIHVDRTRPVVINSDLNKNLAREGEDIIVSVTFSEEMDPSSVKIEDSGLGLIKDTHSSTDRIFVYLYTVKPSDAGIREKIYDISILGSDTFDNKIAESYAIGTVILDLTPPDNSKITDLEIITATSSFYTVDSLPVASTYQPEIEYSFNITNASEIFERPEVFIGYNPAPITDCNGDETVISCYGTYNISGDEGEGVKHLTVNLYDAVGNRVTYTPGAVIFDFTGPRLVSTSVTRDPAFAHSRDETGKIQYFSRKDPFSEKNVQLVLTMYADELIDTDFSNTIDYLPCETDSYAVKPEEISGNSLTHIRTVNDCLGLYSPMVIWRDFVGNETARESDWKISIVDDQPDPLNIKRDYITYYRKPFGSIDSTATPRFYVTSSPKTVMSDDIVMVAFYTETGILAGTAVVGDDGSFSVDTLTGGDVPVIYINPVSFTGNKIPVKDDLGNPYDIKTVLQPVPNVVWTANLNRKIQGSQWPNPTTFINTSAETNYLVRDSFLNSYETSELPSSVYSGVSSSKRDGAQIQVFEDPMSSFYRTGRASAYNPAKDELLVFGGRTVSDGSSMELWFNDLAVWNGDKWKIIETEGQTPDKSENASMVYFEAKDQYVLFGGSKNIDMVQYYYSQTWIWTGNYWINTGKTGPKARDNGAMAYDPVRKKAVLFGGRDPYGTINPIDGHKYADDGTWEWDGETWLNIPVSGPDPSAGEMVYDLTSRKLIYYDGISGSTWSYDGLIWETLATGGQQLKNFNMVYDSLLNRTLIYGGIKPDYSYSNSVYSFNGSSWTALAAAPYQIADHVMWYSKSKNTAYAAFGAYNDLWIDPFRNLLELKGSVWKERTFQTHGVASPSITYYPTKNKVYMFGGETDEFSDTYTFEFDGLRWDRVNNGATRPTTVTDNDLIYYPPADVLLLFERSPARMWQYNGSTWSIRTTTGSPSKIDSYKMEYFPEQGHVVFIATTTEGNIETWTYNGSTWTNVCRDGVPGGCIQPDLIFNEDFSISYNSQAQKVFGFMSGDHSGDIETWRWTGSVWQAVSVTDPENDGTPGFIYNPSASYSQAYKSTIVSGTNNTDSFEIWLFNGTSYRKIEQYDISKRFYFDSVWMENEQALLIRGGRVGRMSTDYFVKDYFVVKLPQNVVPTQQYIIPMSTAGMPNEAVIRKIDVSWIGGGTTKTETADNNLAILSFWYKNGWEELTYGSGSSSSNSLMFEEINDPDIIDFMQNGIENNISFKINPKIIGTYSYSTPVISTSAVEVDVYYNVEGKRDIPRYLDSQYYIPSKQFDYESARRTCLEWGGDLLIINNEDEENIVRDLVGFDDSIQYWIGVNDIHRDLDFRTVSGRLIYSNGVIDGNYVKWAKYHPYTSTTDNCVYLLNGRWSLGNCAVAGNFICEKTRENSYVISTKTENWANAKAVCELLNMDLVIMNGPFEQSKIEKMTGGTTDFWIGYTDADVEGTWRWVNGLTGWIGNSEGTPYYYNNWGTGYPSTASGTYDFAFISMAGNKKWRNNAAGTLLKHYICEENSEEMFCSLNNQDCTLSDECCSGICSDNYGECVACLKNGDSSCAAGSNCCSGICNTSSKECAECLNLNQPTCTSATDCCDKSATCASGKCCYSLGLDCSLNSECCTGMSCGDESKCCKSLTTSCLLNSECCTGVCTGVTKKFCSCRTTDQSCIINSNCCTGICSKGICQCSELGDQCLTTTDCCKGICSKGKCQ